MHSVPLKMSFFSPLLPLPPLPLHPHYLLMTPINEYYPPHQRTAMAVPDTGKHCPGKIRGYCLRKLSCDIVALPCVSLTWQLWNRQWRTEQQKNARTSVNRQCVFLSLPTGSVNFKCKLSEIVLGFMKLHSLAYGSSIKIMIPAASCLLTALL